MSESMMMTVEGTNAVFLKQITMKRARRTTYRTRTTLEAIDVLNAAGIQTAGTYIRRR